MRRAVCWTRPARRVDDSGVRRVWLIVVLVALAIKASVAVAKPLEQVVSKGPVEATVRLEPSNPQIGDAVMLSLRVVAQKDVELLMPQFGGLLARFAILDVVSTEQIDDQQRTVVTQRYELQPSRSGRESIPPLLIEFVDRRPGATPAPEGYDAYELLTERMGFEVRSVLPDDAKAQLHPHLGPVPLEPEGRRAVWPWAAALAALVAVAGAILWRFYSASRRKARRRSAYEIAIGRLNRLLACEPDTAEQFGAFFVELSGIVRHYLENRFELRAPELTTEEFLDQMSGSPDLGRDHQSLLRAFLRRADLVKFANVVPTAEDVDQSVAAARQFLNETGREPQGGREPGAGSTTSGVAGG